MDEGSLLTPANRDRGAAADPSGGGTTIGRFAIPFLAVLLTGGLIALWQVWLERESAAVRVLALVIYMGLMVVLVRALRAQLLGLPE